MAERRMFAKTVIDSDEFLDMPATTQLLYFHLSMRADDDGFVNNPKKILRMTGMQDDDLKLLITKKFIIPFETGIIVIRHWKIHNYIQKDRYKPTSHKVERSMLTLENNIYVPVTEGDLLPEADSSETQDTECVQDVSDMDTQDRLGKVRLELGKVRLDKERGGDVADATPPAPYDEISNLYNSICQSLPKVKRLSDVRKKAIRARLRNYSLDDFRQLFTMAESSAFLKGKNSRDWSADFDWLIKDANMAKVLDGNYEDRKAVGNQHGADGTPHPDGGVWLNGKQVLGV